MLELSRRMAMLAAIVAGCAAAVPEVWAVVFVLLFNLFAAKKFTSSVYAFKINPTCTVQWIRLRGGGDSKPN